MTQVSEKGKAYYIYIQRLIARLVTRRGAVRSGAVGVVRQLQPMVLWGRATGRSSKGGLGPLERAPYTRLSSNCKALLKVLSKGMTGSDLFSKKTMLNAGWRVYLSKN